MTQINTKKVIRQVLHNAHLIPFRIKHKAPSKEDMNKIIFVKVLTNLKKIEDRKDFMVEEIGMDMTAYEDQFFEVIEDLFKMTFNKEQLALIQLYLYQLMPDKEWDGTITIENKNKEEKEVDFKSPTDVWKVINSIK
tara:strand:+ start:129 stop:539 length:411 start_codon:yes stop_codon:yes gene_type:complete